MGLDSVLTVLLNWLSDDLGFLGYKNNKIRVLILIRVFLKYEYLIKLTVLQFSECGLAQQ